MYEEGQNEYRDTNLRNQILIIISVGLAIFFLIGMYNKMVDRNEDVNLAKANVETMMQRRLELIPDLVETVKAYSKHEEKVFEDIANARAALATTLNSETAENAEISEANAELSRQINNLLAIAEDYPTLTSSQQYTSLMDQLEGSVNRIAIARTEYNQEVSDYNRAIKKFPTSLWAKIFGFEEIEPFESDKEAEKINMVNFE